MKPIRTTLACLLIMAISGLTGWWLKAVQPRPVPSIEWIQEKVGAKVDGKLCKSWNVPGHSETQRLWERIDFNKLAVVYFTESGGLE